MTYPTITPKLTLDFANSRQLDPRITFSRSSTATYLHPDTGLITTAPSGVARFEKEGFLVEEARTNLIDYSTDFQNQWAGGSATNNQTSAPDGTSTAAKYAAAATVSLNKTYTSTSRPNTAVKFNLATGTYDSTIVGTPTDYDIEPYGNGWYRCYFSVSSTTFSVFAKKGELDYIVIQLSNVKGFIYARNATDNNTTTSDGIYIWGAQIEEDNFPTSYIPTSGSTVTRAKDNANITGDNFANWWNGSENTMILEAISPYVHVHRSLGKVIGTSGNTDSITYKPLNSKAYANSLRIWTNFRITTWYAGVLQKFALAYNSTAPIYVSGSQSFTRSYDAAFSPIDAQEFILGDSWSGTMSRISYYDRRVSDAALQSLTS